MGLPAPHSPLTLAGVCQQTTVHTNEPASSLLFPAVDPKVVSVANRVAEIVYSWPPLENQGPSLGSKGNFLQQVPDIQQQGANTRIRLVGGGKIGNKPALGWAGHASRSPLSAHRNRGQWARGEGRAAGGLHSCLSSTADPIRLSKLTADS